MLSVVLIQQVLASPANPILADSEQTDRSAHEGRPSEYYYLGWIIMYLAAVWLLGLPLAAFLFIVAFIGSECGVRIKRDVAIAAAFVGVLWVLSAFLGIEYPQGMLAEYLPL